MFNDSYNLYSPYHFEHTQSFVLNNEEETTQLGKHIVPLIKEGFLLYLYGDLGAGKTTLTRGLLRGLGITGTLRSPTYALLEPYDAIEPLNKNNGILHHFDFYRLKKTPLAWKEAGFIESFEPPHAAIVEWPQYAVNLPKPTLMIELKHQDTHRLALISSDTPFIFKPY